MVYAGLTYAVITLVFLMSELGLLLLLRKRAKWSLVTVALAEFAYLYCFLLLIVCDLDILNENIRMYTVGYMIWFLYLVALPGFFIGIAALLFAIGEWVWKKNQEL